MPESPAPQIKLIPVSQVSVLNPRERNKKKFEEIVASIAEIGLKRPITVTQSTAKGPDWYDLVCGQGRLEAFQQLGQSEIPAIIIDADPLDCMMKSLVENCARRQHQPIDLVHDIGGMRERGYTDHEIAKKTGLTVEYVRAIAKLLAQDERRLLRAVESGHVPFSVAVQIADADEDDVQDALQEAYEKNVLRGRKLLVAKRLIESRSRRGKDLSPSTRSRAHLSTDALVKAYQEDTDRKRLLLRKADMTRSRLIFITHALRELFHDELFAGVLRSEELDTVPKKLAARMDRQELL
ncbi:plasmid partitioning protein RepB C-terminal domain-containing protein [uncultured Roseibium sp.]|uniref:plasmid partitioning protein RepB C-terminal domain-containing protein n=1 Tax=uncultured Roseibium sp. TaxID=1936171 RepID=UPI00262CC8A7|nr:plasmid partitioning protein RepB C-terminal domain-containing protein [uncultured Roseibium sp.]